MVEKDTLLKETVKYAGVVDFPGIYNFLFEWVKDEKYDITEDLYTEKVKGDAKDIDIKWTASKKLTDYFKSAIDIKWRILGMKDVEVQIDGKKKKMNKLAELKIDIKGVLEKDYDNKWNSSTTAKFFKEIYNKYVIPGRTSEMESKIISFVQDMKEEAKAFLELTGKR